MLLVTGHSQGHETRVAGRQTHTATPPGSPAPGTGVAAVLARDTLLGYVTVRDSIGAKSSFRQNRPWCCKLDLESYGEYVQRDLPADREDPRV